MAGENIPIVGDWNIERSELSRREVAQKRADVCFWEQERRIFLDLFGGRINPENPCGNVSAFSVPLNRTYLFSAIVVSCGETGPTRNILVVRVPGSESSIQFLDGTIVLQPVVEPVKRITECNQIVRFLERETFIEIDPFTFIRVEVGDIIRAVDGRVVIERIPDNELARSREERLAGINDPELISLRTKLGENDQVSLNLE